MQLESALKAAFGLGEGESVVGLSMTEEDDDAGLQVIPLSVLPSIAALPLAASGDLVSAGGTYHLVLAANGAAAGPGAASSSRPRQNSLSTESRGPNGGDEEGPVTPTSGRAQSVSPSSLYPQHAAAQSSVSCSMTQLQAAVVFATQRNAVRDHVCGAVAFAVGGHLDLFVDVGARLGAATSSSSSSPSPSSSSSSSATKTSSSLLPLVPSLAALKDRFPGGHGPGGDQHNCAGTTGRKKKRRKGRKSRGNAVSNLLAVSDTDKDGRIR
jgi:hypothetical protein